MSSIRKGSPSAIPSTATTGGGGGRTGGALAARWAVSSPVVRSVARVARTTGAALVVGPVAALVSVILLALDKLPDCSRDARDERHLETPVALVSLALPKPMGLSDRLAELPDSAVVHVTRTYPVEGIQIILGDAGTQLQPLKRLSATL